MPRRKIPLFDLTITAQTRREVDRVLRSGWLNTGPKVAAFEQAIARLVGVRYAAAVNSATAGLQLTLEALGIGAKNEVITSPFTFASTAASILRVGAVPVFADIDPDTLNIDPDEIERKVTTRTAAVLAVDIAGLPADYRRLREICTRRRVALIADAAHSLGAALAGRSAAQWADAAVHSFQITKNLTSGDGGMVLSRHKPLVDRVRVLANYAMTSGAYQRRRSGGWEYDIVGIGQKANMTDLNAAVGLGQLPAFQKNQAKRARLAARYLDRLADLSELLHLPAPAPRYRHAWHLFIIRLHLSRLRIDRASFIRRLAAAGIQCEVHYVPLFEMSFYRKLGYSGQHLPNAAYAGQRVVTLPLYPEMTFADVDYICDRIRMVLTNSRQAGRQ